MCLILSLAGIVVTYVAYPHRGAELAAAPWLSGALRKGVEVWPEVIDDRSDEFESAPASELLRS
ncbi:MAG: hypothetical protein ACRCYQ_01630 [Nocardioides sp.]